MTDKGVEYKINEIRTDPVYLRLKNKNRSDHEKKVFAQFERKLLELEKQKSDNNLPVEPIRSSRNGLVQAKPAHRNQPPGVAFRNQHNTAKKNWVVIDGITVPASGPGVTTTLPGHILKARKDEDTEKRPVTYIAAKKVGSKPKKSEKEARKVRLELQQKLMAQNNIEQNSQIALDIMEQQKAIKQADKSAESQESDDSDDSDKSAESSDESDSSEKSKKTKVTKVNNVENIETPKTIETPKFVTNSSNSKTQAKTVETKVVKVEQPVKPKTSHIPSKNESIKIDTNKKSVATIKEINKKNIVQKAKNNQISQKIKTGTTQIAKNEPQKNPVKAPSKPDKPTHKSTKFTQANKNTDVKKKSSKSEKSDKTQVKKKSSKTSKSDDSVSGSSGSSDSSSEEIDFSGLKGYEDLLDKEDTSELIDADD